MPFNFVSLLVAGVLLVAAWIFTCALPNRRLASSKLTDQEKAALRNEHRKTFGQFIGGAAVLLGLYVSWHEFRASQAATLNAEQARDRAEFTGRYSTAVEHLSSDKTSLKLGGVFALERLARDSAADHWSVMEVLTAFVRESARWKSVDPGTIEPQPADDPSEIFANYKVRSPEARDKEINFSNYTGRPPAEVQAALTVLGRRWLGDTKQEQDLREGGRHLDLRGVDLRGADLSGLNFKNALFSGAHLEYAKFYNCQLDQADFKRAYLAGSELTLSGLKGADFSDANLEGAFLNFSHLEDTNFFFANLGNARLVGVYCGKTNLDRANLRGAYLDNANGITRADFEPKTLGGAPFIDEATEPPAKPTPDWWPEVLKRSLDLQQFIREEAVKKSDLKKPKKK